MRRPTACGAAFLFAATFVLSMFPCHARAQGLFSNRASGAQNQTSSTANTALLFSRNTWFPNANPSETSGSSFVGRANQGFVGSRAATQSSGPEGGASNRGGAAPRGTVGEGAETTSPGRQPESARRLPRRTIVPRHRIAFEFPAKPTTAIRHQLRTQLKNLAARNPDFGGISVRVEPGGRVRLRGQVASESTRKLAAILIRLEPGVRAVDNELTLEPLVAE